MYICHVHIYMYMEFVATIISYHFTWFEATIAHLKGIYSKLNKISKELES